MKNEQPEISRFIDEISKVLPAENELVRIDTVPMFGFELKLTAIKEYNGSPIDEAAVYQIEVPVYKGIMIPHKDLTTGEVTHEPTVRYTDHKHLLRLAFLRNGLQGIYSYLSRYMSEESVNKVRRHFMSVTA